jgi:hypothetical protein
MRITRESINELYPNTAYVIKNDSVLEILDDTVVSYEDIVQKVAELEYQEELNEYQRQRAAEYPSYPDQFDKIYHSGVNVWKTQIKTVKDKYPKQTMDADELQTRKNKAIFDLQTERYIKATTRLSQYKLSEGRPEVKDEDDVVTQTAIEPLESTIEVSTTNPETMEVTTETVPNPVIVKDEEERAAAQSVVDATPQPVIDSINN